MALVNHKVIAALRTMSRKQKMVLLTEVIQNMVERDSAEEMAKFLGEQLGGDDEAVVLAHWQKPVKK